MITVYDMTSGTLRKELEDGRHTQGTQPAARPDTVYVAELHLQEIEMGAPAPEQGLPDYMAHVNAEEFIKSMK